MAKLINRLDICKGTVLEFYLDTSAPPSSPDRHYSLTIFSGAPDAKPLGVPQHWHNLHDEYMTVLAGSMEFCVDGKTTIVHAGDPVVEIPRRVVHGIKFLPNKRGVLKERTAPTGEFKQKFFEDVFRAGGMGQKLRAFADGDTYLPVPIVNSRWVDEWVMWVIGSVLGTLMPRVKPASRAEGEGRKDM
ncbi:hypothetical protein NX059_005789 [Plenodomus lindquistii]|nr:hypothetical protein NX059_005789 [Plenodomus lindquistii]